MTGPAGKLTIVGAGPGDPELLTLRGKKAIDEADLVFATTNGEPVDPRFFAGAKPGAEIVDGSRLSVDEYYRRAIDAVRSGKRVVRLQPGDPSLFGSLAKQLKRFAQEGIRVEVVPGVSVGLAAACGLGADLTIPGVSEAVLLTRMEGALPVPPGQKLAELATHRPTIVLYLSTTLIAQLARELAKSLPPATPVLVAQKVGWPAEKVVRGTLADIVEKVRTAGVFTQAVVLVGDVFDPRAIDAVDPSSYW